MCVMKMFPRFPPPMHPPPPLPFSREAMKEMQHFVILMLLNEKQGITGYELETKYRLPRITAIRILEGLNREDYVSAKEEIVAGRARKYYYLTEKGLEYYNQLKEKWALNLAIMSERAPPEKFGYPLFPPPPMIHERQAVKELNTKEDALDYLHSLRFRVKKHEQVLQERIKNLQNSKQELDNLIKQIETMAETNIEEIKRRITEFLQQMGFEVKENDE